MLKVTTGALVISILMALPAAAERPRAFLELFTSQGCSACPAADARVATFEEEEDVLAVTMPVQLWDFLGWEDTLATEASTRRQFDYSVSRGDRDVFTPQVVVNGTESIVGNDLDGLRSAIDDGGSRLPVDIGLSVANDVLSVDVGGGDTNGQKVTLWLLVVDDRVSVPIAGGENRGRKLTYHNVVRQMRPIGMWYGEEMSLDLPLSDLRKGTNAGCYVIAQVETYRGPGKIIGAAKLEKLFPARGVN